MNSWRTLRYLWGHGAVNRMADAGLRPRRGLLVALAVLIPAIPLAIGIVIGLRGSGRRRRPRPRPRLRPRFTPAASRAPADAGATPARPPVPGDSAGDQAPRCPPARARWSRSCVASDRAARGPRADESRPPLHANRVRLTRDAVGGPAGSGLARRGGDRRPATVGSAGSRRARPRSAGSPGSSKVSLAARRLTVLDTRQASSRGTRWRSGAPARRRPPVASPSPTGCVTGNPAGPYGCCILALSAHSPHAIQGWTGGTRIAIHSTPDDLEHRRGRRATAACG